MKQKICLLIAGIGVILCLAAPVRAEDNDIFGECGTILEPNILIIIDSSGSMNTDVTQGKTRMDVAKEAIRDLIDEHADSNPVRPDAVSQQQLL